MNLLDIDIGGRGLACILGFGAIVLAYTKNPLWEPFLTAALVVYFANMIFRGNKGNRKKRSGKREKDSFSSYLYTKPL